MKITNLLLILAIVAFLVFTFDRKSSEKDENTDESKEDSNETISVSTPPIVSNESGGAKLYDLDTGIGKEAFEKQVQNIYRNKSIMQSIRQENNLANDLLNGAQISAEGEKRFKENFVQQGNFVDYTDLNFFDNADTIRRLEQVILYEESFDGGGMDSLRDGAKFVLNLLDFSGKKGMNFFTFANSYDELRKNFIDSKRVYGDTKDKPDNENRNHGKFFRDAAAFSKNALQVIEAQKPIVEELAIEQLRQSGWKFLGYDQP